MVPCVDDTAADVLAFSRSLESVYIRCEVRGRVSTDAIAYVSVLSRLYTQSIIVSPILIQSPQ